MTQAEALKEQVAWACRILGMGGHTDLTLGHVSAYDPESGHCFMKRKGLGIDETTPEALGVDIAPRLKVLAVEEPKSRQAGIKVEDAGALVDKLKNEAGVL